MLAKVSTLDVWKGSECASEDTHTFVKDYLPRKNKVTVPSSGALLWQKAIFFLILVKNYVELSCDAALCCNMKKCLKCRQ